MIDSEIVLNILRNTEVRVGSMFLLLLIILNMTEPFLSPDIKKKIADYVFAKWNDRSVEAWPTTFLSLMESIYGKKTISVRFISYSIAASLFSVVFFVSIWMLLNDNINWNQLVMSVFSTANQFPLSKMHALFPAAMILAIFIVGPIQNCIFDFLSLIESRYIVYRMVDNTWVTILFLLAVDFFVTTSLAFAALMLLLLLTGNQLTWHVIGSGLRLEGVFGAYGALFYSTYLTSVWVWLYVLSVAGMRSVLGIQVARNIFDNIWSKDKVEKNPFRFLQVIVLIVTFLYICVKHLISGVLG